MFVDFFIKRPIFATVCALIIILGGAVSIPSLPISQFPNLAPPQVNVSSFYNGAERANRGIGRHHSSRAVHQRSRRAAIHHLHIRERWQQRHHCHCSMCRATLDLAAVDVQNRVQAALGVLARAGEKYRRDRHKRSGRIRVCRGVLFADNNKYSGLFISNYIDVYVSDAIKRVPGVANVTVFGERLYSMRLWLDPARLAQRGLTATDVVSALQEQNVQVAAGQIGQPPAPTGQAFQISVRAMGQLIEPSEFDNIILKTGTDGTLVRVKDVGHSELGAQDYSSNLFINGHEAIGLAYPAASERERPGRGPSGKS